MYSKFEYIGETRCAISRRVITRADEAIEFKCSELSGYAEASESKVLVLKEEFERVCSPFEVPAAPSCSPCYGGRKFTLILTVDEAIDDELLAFELLKAHRNPKAEGGYVNGWSRLASTKSGSAVFGRNYNNLRNNGELDTIEHYVKRGSIIADAYVRGVYVGSASVEWRTRDEFGRYLRKSERGDKSELLKQLDTITAPYKGFVNY